jgi:DNA-binding transcriptional MocR family regulator
VRALVQVEEPSYFLALSIFRDFGLKIESVGIDTDGMKTE